MPDLQKNKKEQRKNCWKRIEKTYQELGIGKNFLERKQHQELAGGIIWK